MARYRYRRYFRRRYRRRGTTINQKAYQKARIDCLYTVKYPTNSGALSFVRNGEAKATLTANEILQDSTYFAQMRAVWGYSKITGVAVTFMPSPNIRAALGGIKDWAAVGGWIYGNTGGATFQSCLASDNSVLLNPFGPVRKYVSIKGATWWSNLINENGTGILAVFANQNATYESDLNFMCKVSIYLTLAKSNL